MKPIKYTVLAVIAAALSAQGADEKPAETPAQEPTPAGEETAGETGAAPEAAAAEAAPVDGPAGEVRNKLKKMNEVYAQLKKPTRYATSQHTSATTSAETSLKKIEDAQKAIAEIKAKMEAFATEAYEFATIPAEDRDKFEREGTEMVNKVLKALKGKSENEKLEGIRLFEKLRESYQGISTFKEALAVYKNVTGFFEKKWARYFENLRKERQKNDGNKNDKLQEMENAQLEKLAKKMEDAGGNIDEDLFLPRPSNSRMLEKALSRLKRSMQSSLNKVQEEAEDVPGLFRAFWASMDEMRELMMKGEYERVNEMLNDNESYRALSSVQHYAMPQEYKDTLRKQHDEFRSEVRRRNMESRNLERDLQREERNLEREMQLITTRIDRVIEALEEEKEQELRREEEAAAAAAEEEARLAAEAAENDDADEDEQPKPKKKTKKKTKKKAEKEG